MFTRILILAVLVIAIVSGAAFFVRQQSGDTPNVALTEEEQEEIARILGDQNGDVVHNEDLRDEMTQDDANTQGNVDSSEPALPTTAPVAPIVAGTSVASFVPRAQAAAPVSGSWELIAFDREKWDIDDEDDDVDEIRYKKDVCKQMKDSLRVPVECRKTSKLKRDRAASLGNDKCSASCNVGASCVLWNSDEKKDGSLTLNIANYMCS